MTDPAFVEADPPGTQGDSEAAVLTDGQTPPSAEPGTVHWDLEPEVVGKARHLLASAGTRSETRPVGCLLGLLALISPQVVQFPLWIFTNLLSPSLYSWRSSGGDVVAAEAPGRYHDY